MKVRLREWRRSDLEDLVRFANNSNIAKFMTDQFPYPYEEDNGRYFIQMTQSHHPQRIFAIDVDGVAVGSIGIHPQNDIHRKNAELGYWLAEEYWGRGILSMLLPEVVQFAFENFDIDRVFAKPFNTNLASQKVLVKSGFILEAKIERSLIKNGERLDELIYSVRR
jgi:[ribosomal protein S5]-alanine N-acetyltransferase